jgi:hypothetical protein
MSASFGLIIGAALLGLLVLFIVKVVLAARALEKEADDLLDEPGHFEVCPAEFVDRIFSTEDREFIRGLKTRSLQQFFEKERTALALLWVRQTASAIRRVMQQHAEAARRSADLRFMMEIRLFVQYSGLMLICGALFILIQLAGPLWLRGLAGYAQTLSQKIADAQRAFTATVDSGVVGLQGL